MEVDPSMQISEELFFSRRLKNQLASAGLSVEGSLHSDGEPHPLDRIHSRGNDPVKEEFRELEGGMVVLDEDHVSFFDSVPDGTSSIPRAARRRIFPGGGRSAYPLVSVHFILLPRIFSICGMSAPSMTCPSMRKRGVPVTPIRAPISLWA